MFLYLEQLDLEIYFCVYCSSPNSVKISVALSPNFSHILCVTVCELNIFNFEGIGVVSDTM